MCHNCSDLTSLLLLFIQSQQSDDASSKRQDGLYFLSKMRVGSDRRFTQRSLEMIAGLLQVVLPQSVNVLRILHARVPIVKFSHVATGIECDVCLENEYVFMLHTHISSTLPWEDWG